MSGRVVFSSLLALLLLVLTSSASAHTDRVRRALGCPLQNCTITFTIQPVATTGNPTTSNPPTLGGQASWNISMSPDYLGDNCANATINIGVTGANPQNVSWTGQATPQGGLVKGYTGTNSGSDHVHISASIAGCNGNVYNVQYSGDQDYNIGWGIDLKDNGKCQDPWAPDLNVNAAFRSAFMAQCVDDPVGEGMGRYENGVVDASFAAPGLPFTFARSYTSGDTTHGDLGYGWHDQFDAWVAQVNSSTLYVYLGTGQRITFTNNGSGWVGPPDEPITLQAVSPGYVVSFPNHSSLTFNVQPGGAAVLGGVGDHGQSLTVTSKGYGLPWKVTTSNGKMIVFTYDASNRITQLTLPDGRNVQYSYDANGNLATVTDLRGGVTHYTYDSYHRLLTVVDPRGKTVVTNTYDAWNRLASQTDALNHTTTYTWNPDGNTATATDARGHTWTDTYSAAGMLLTTTDPLGHTATYSYDATTRDPLTYQSPAGDSESFQYNSSRNLTQTTLPGSLTASATYNGAGDVLTTTDPNGHTTSYSYDSNGEPTQITFPGGATIGLTYNSHEQPTAVTNELNKTTTNTYDANGNLTATTTPLGNKTTYGYDSAGRVTSIVDPRGNVSGANPADYTTTIAYDNADNITSVTDPLGHTTSYTYDADGNLSTVTDPNGHEWQYSYDDNDRLTTVTAPDLTTTTYAYDAVGNLISRTDGNNHTTSYTYDNANRLSSVTDPLQRVWTFNYDADSNLTAVHTPSGGTISYSYDGLDRLSGASYSDGTASVSFGYDNAGNRTSMSDGAGTLNYTFNARDELTQASRGLQSFAYTYDAAGRLTSRTYPDGTITSYTYDDDGNLATATTNGQTTSYQYDSAGNLTQTSLPNGVTETYSYDHAGRLTQLNDGFRTFSYGYDNAGNVTSRTLAGVATTYSYDALDRLTDITTGSTTTAYSYDAVGNRTQQTDSAGTTTYAYDAADELTSTTGPNGVTSYTYDDNGNQTTAGAWTYTFNLANQLTAAGNGTSSVTYTYDGDGNRLSATTAGAITNYLWDTNGLPQLALEEDNSGNLLRRYSYGVGRISMTTPDVTAYYSSDAIGSVTEMSGSGGALLGQYDSDPFGDNSTSSNVDPSVASNPFGFAGEYQDPTTGLYDLRARQYDPGSGSFLSLDPLGPSVGASPYVYVGDNPLGYTDPSGMRRDPAGSGPHPCVGPRCLAIFGQPCTFGMLFHICPSPGPVKIPPHRTRRRGSEPPSEPCTVANDGAIKIQPDGSVWVCVANGEHGFMGEWVQTGTITFPGIG